MTQEIASSNGGDRFRERVPVLYLAPWVDFGGTDKGTIDWFRWLDRDRFAPSLITTQPSPNRRLVEVAPFAEEMWALHECMSGRQFPGFIFDFLQTRGVRLLHVMNSRLAFDLLPDLTFLDEPPVVVVQLHVEEPDRSGYVRYVTTRYGNLVDGFSVSSRHLAAALEEYEIPRAKVHVIPTGVDAEGEFNPERVDGRDQDEDTFRILVAGRLAEQKDPLLMVEVVKRLVTRGDRLRVEVVGDGPLKPEVERRVRELHLDRHIRFHPPTPKLVRWLAKSDVLLMTSTFEGVPYTAYEALAMQVPVVAPALPGNVELMGQGEGCLIEPRDDPDAYAEAIGALIDDDRLRRRIGAAGRARMLESFTVQDMARGHERLYEKLLTTREGSLLAGGQRRLPPPRKRQPPPTLPARPAPLRFTSRPTRAKPLVSIITPCYNHGRYLPSFMEGIAAQDYPAIELVIVDDGSDDPDTLEQLARLERNESARVIRQPRNRGPSAARNRALEVATGRYILPVDADNVLLPGAVRSLVQQLQSAGERVGFVYPSYQYFGNRDYCFRAPAYNLWALLSSNFADTCSLLDRDIFDAGLRYPEDIELGHEDWDLVLALAAHDVIGQPSRDVVMLYRKQGFTRSDLVEYARLPFSNEIKDRHPELLGSDKARFSPALSVVAAEPVEFDSVAGDALLKAFWAQSCRDFELIVECPTLRADNDAVVRRVPPGLAGSIAERIEEALSISRGRYLLVARSPAELLTDPTMVERLLRGFTSDPELRAVAFADLGNRAGRFPCALIERADAALPAHAVGWRRELHGELGGPLELAEEGVVETLAWAINDRVVQMQWRHFPVAAGRRPHARERHRSIALEPRRATTVFDRSERAERYARMRVAPAVPGLRPNQVHRWGHSRHWMPPETMPLVRHVNESGTWRLVTNSFESPPGATVEFVLGSIQRFSPPGTRRLIRRDGRHLTAECASPHGEGDEVLGYLEEASLPLFGVIERAVLEDGSETLVACTERDHLRQRARELTLLGHIEGLPNEPVRLPPYTESRPVLVRWIGYENRMHTYGTLTPPDSTNGGFVLGGELGRLQLHPDSKAIPVWLDAAGRISTDRYSFAAPPLSPVSLMQYSAAPLNWRGFGQRSARVRATFRRLLDSRRLLVSPGRRKSSDQNGQRLLGYLRSEPGPGLIELFAARHRVLPDQFVTHHPLEATDLGYVDVCSLGYIQADAPLTGALGSKRVGVPWASRFGLAARVG